MRCYFLRAGHIADVSILKDGASDEEAIEQAKALFQSRHDEFDGFEVWDLERPVYGSPFLEKGDRQSQEGDAA